MARPLRVNGWLLLFHGGFIGQLRPLVAACQKAKAYLEWFRVKFFQRFRLFFRYHGKARIIVFAWLNDETTLRTRGARNDPYAVFRAGLERGDPPPDWATLVKACGPLPDDVQQSLPEARRDRPG